MKIELLDNGCGVAISATKQDKTGKKYYLPIGVLLVKNQAEFFENYHPRAVTSLMLRHSPTGKEVEEPFSHWLAVWGVNDPDLREIFDFIGSHLVTEKDIGSTMSDNVEVTV